MMTEKIFHRIDLTDSAPAGICTRCAESAMQHTLTETKFCYCTHTGTGAMLTSGSSWYMVENVTAENFKNAVLIAVMEGEALATDAIMGGLPMH